MKKSILAVSLMLAACGGGGHSQPSVVETAQPETIPETVLPNPEPPAQPAPVNPEDVPAYPDIEFQTVDGYRIVWGPFRPVRWQTMTAHDRGFVNDAGSAQEVEALYKTLTDYRRQSQQLCESNRFPHMFDIAQRQGNESDMKHYASLIEECNHWINDLVN